MSTPVAIYGAVNVNVHSPETALQMKEMNGGELNNAFRVFLCVSLCDGAAMQIAW